MELKILREGLIRTQQDSCKIGVMLQANNKARIKFTTIWVWLFTSNIDTSIALQYLDWTLFVSIVIIIVHVHVTFITIFDRVAFLCILLFYFW